MKHTNKGTWTFFCVLIVVSLTAMADDSVGNGGIWWSPDLQLSSLVDLPAALSAPVTKEGQPVRLELRNGAAHKTVTNCSEYLEAVDLKMAPSNPLGLDTPYIERCYGLRSLQHAGKPTKDYLGAQWDADSLDRLPPLTVFVEASLSARAAQARAKGKSWKQYDPALSTITVKPKTLLLEDQGNRWFLSTVAKGDFNGDGRSDIVVIACDSKKTGGGGLCFPVVFTAYGPGKVMKLISSLSEPYKVRHAAN